MKEIPKKYEAGKYEDKIYELWEKSGIFNPDNLKLPKNTKPYTIILPPPNITDKLHLGHSAMLAIEDLMIRYHRMKGFRALWLPGTDHAAIATQNAVEKKLLKEKNLTRHDLGKEKFLEEVWNFLRSTQKTILGQIRKMGASLDWSREAFTLDDERKKAVKKMFVDMYNEGLIYRGERIVIWCPRCHSTLADDEIEYEKEIGKLYWIKYGPFVLATTRPETKLGDTAVAVYPGDKRYKDMVGKKYNIPGVLGEFEITVVADRAVDPEFGSGAVKVTPAHDFTDNAIAMRHNISMKQIINEDGKMMGNCGKYAGMATKEAREAIVKDMQVMNLIDHVEENYEHNIAKCYRCGSTIEPLPSKQWFLSVDKKIKKLGNKSLKEKALEAAKKKKIEFIPNRFEKRYADWMNNLHDWCISRQIWFGHEIPVWYKTSPQPSPYKGEGDIVYVGEKAPKGNDWKQDSDTLDTWFSSGMWTFSTLNWLDNFKNNKKFGDLKKFHPTQVLETGYDILTLWVSRMIIMSFFALGEIPFEKVYLHGLVLDKFGKKMSKSKGNGIDPLDMIEKFGADAVRLSLLIGSTPGNDVRISEEKIASYRNFVTKLWNIYRYACNEKDNFKLIEKIEKKDLKTLSDKWIVSQLNNAIFETEKYLNDYKFSLAGEKLQKFTWDELADWYLEIHKLEKNDKVLGYILDKILKLWHPFMPFITEKIWQDFYSAKKILMVEKWPEVNKKLINQKTEKEFSDLQEKIIKIRNLRANYHIEQNKVITAYAKNSEYKEIIEKLARVNILVAKSSGKTVMLPGLELDIANVTDIEKETKKIKENINLLENNIKRNKILLKNDRFMKKASKTVINKFLTSTADYENKLKIQKELLKMIN
jgi:valyl-tRNA synthetase